VNLFTYKEEVDEIRLRRKEGRKERKKVIQKRMKIYMVC